MTRMRGVESFPRLWARRTTFDFDEESLDGGDLARALREEEEAVRTEDEAYWRPLKRELSRLRRERRTPE